jgi:hypothetical protein
MQGFVQSDSTNPSNGVNAGLQRIKGNSPKMLNKDNNRQRTMKSYSNSGAGVGVGAMG